jgi:hypothetical protein
MESIDFRRGNLVSKITSDDRTEKRRTPGAGLPCEATKRGAPAPERER